MESVYLGIALVSAFIAASVMFGMLKSGLSAIKKIRHHPKPMYSYEYVRDHSKQSLVLSTTYNEDNFSEQEIAYKAVCGKVITNLDKNLCAEDYFGVRGDRI